jgi:hypothetical protein
MLNEQPVGNADPVLPFGRDVAWRA